MNKTETILLFQKIMLELEQLKTKTVGDEKFVSKIPRNHNRESSENIKQNRPTNEEIKTNKDLDLKIIMKAETAYHVIQALPESEVARLYQMLGVQSPFQPKQSKSKRNHLLLMQKQQNIYLKS